MSDSKPNLEGPPIGTPIANETRLEATKAQIDNVSQIVNSPGTVVNQILVSHDQSATGAWVTIGLGVVAVSAGSVLLATEGLTTRGQVAFVAQFVVGVGLIMIVGGFFWLAESLLIAKTKKQIADKLLGAEQVVQLWLQTFTEVFDRMFGQKHLSWKCFRRSCAVSAIGAFLMLCIWATRHPDQLVAYFHRNDLPPFVELLPNFLLVSAIPDYISLRKSRYLLNIMADPSPAKTSSAARVFLLIATDCLVSAAIAMAAYGLYTLFGAPLFRAQDAVQSNFRIFFEWPNLDARLGTMPLAAFLYPSFFTVVWVSLYGLAGILVKIAHSLGLLWRMFDIEKKPLQAIGLVAGALVALAYWAVAIMSSFIGT